MSPRILVVLGFVAYASVAWLVDPVALGAEPPTTAPSAAPTSMPTAGLVAYYPLDGNAADRSGAGHDGRIISATPTMDRFGRDNRALQFDGVRDEIEIDPPPPLTSKAMSVSIWVRVDPPDGRPPWVDVMDGNGTYQDPIIGQDDGYHIRSWQLWINDRRIVWQRMGEFSSAWTKWKVQPDRWYHVVATFQANSHTLYVDGKQEHQVKGVFKACPSEPLRIGAKGDASTKRAHFAGAVDDLRLYDRALSAAEVATLFAEGQH